MLARSVTLSICTGQCNAQLLVLAEYPACGSGNPIAYPYLLRTPTLQEAAPFVWETVERKYRSNLTGYVNELADLVSQRDDRKQCDVVLAAPSSRPQVTIPYLAELKNRNPTAVDLTQCFQKARGLFSGRNGVTQTQVNASITCSQPPCNLEASWSYLLVDDIYAEGKTATAVANHLARQIGTAPDLTIACLLKVGK